MEKEKYSSFVEMLKDMAGLIESRMDIIEDVSLEDEDYNDLYLSLREARNAILKATKVQYKIDKEQESKMFWEDMKRMRRPDDNIAGEK